MPGPSSVYTHCHENHSPVIEAIAMTSVLMGNTPRVKFMRNYIQNPTGVFSIPSLVKMIDDVISQFSRLFVQTVSFSLKRKGIYLLAGRYELYCLVRPLSQIKFLFSRVISLM